ncbi:AMP-binding protein [Streptomyces aurantiacus]|nr:AMP-binding protein [Streptomyces aurantiacus]
MPASAAASLLHTLVTAAAYHRPDAIAVCDGRGTWSYAELDQHSRTYADSLARSGVGAGDRVLIRAVAERWVLAAIYACSRLGAIAVPLSPDLRPAQEQQIVADAEPSLVLTSAPETGPPLGDRPKPDGPPARADADVLFLYTSGSTAQPKAVRCPHAQVLFATGAIAARLGYRSDDVILCRLPLSFDYGLYQAFMAASVGATVLLRGPGRDSGMLAAIRRHAVTVVPVVPSLAHMLIRLGRHATAPGVRLVTNTGQALSAAQIDGIRRVFPHTTVRLMYGITECKRVTIADPDSDLTHPGSVGRPLPGTTVRIVDAQGASLPVGAEGQIVVSGAHLMVGYWKDDALTRQIYRTDAVTGERTLYTGDYGHLDDAGRLYFHGRYDDLFKQGDVRTSAAEIEAAVLADPQVADAALVPPSGDRPAVLFTVTALRSDEVLRRLRERLEPLKVPKICRVVAELPIGSTGKTNRAALRARANQEAAQHVGASSAPGLRLPPPADRS